MTTIGPLRSPLSHCRDGGEGQQPNGAGADDHGLVPLVTKRGVRSARGGLDQYGSFVAEVGRYVDELAWVSDHRVAPATARVAAEAALQAGLEMAERDPFAQVDLSALRTRDTGLMPRVAHDSTGTRATLAAARS